MLLKKLYKLFFAVALSAALILTGCSKGEDAVKTGQNGITAADASSAEKTANQENPYEKSYDISWVSWSCGDIEQDNWAAKKIEEKLNIKLSTKKVDLSQAQQVDLMLASGEMPDCGWLISKSPADMDGQGLIRSIPKSMIKEYAPNYYALLDSEPVGWKLNTVKDNPDEFLCLSGYQAGNMDSVTFISAYRLDWLENVGIKPNGTLEQIDTEGRMYTTDTPFTLDQFTAILKAFTKSDPDKNGSDDTMGMTAGGNSIFFWAPLYGMFNFQDSGTLEENGKAVAYYVSNRYKEFLKYAGQMYKDGCLDKEFPTLTVDKAWEKIAAGKVGYSGTSALWSNMQYKARPPLSMIQKDPGAKVLVAPPETGNDGKGGTRPYSLLNYSYYFYVNREVSDDKLARILQMFDYINFDKDAKIYLRYGEEGTHYKWSGTPYESAPVLNEGVKRGSDTGIWSYNSNYVADYDIKKLGWEETTAKIMKYAWGDWTKYLLKPYKADLFNQTKYQEYYTQYQATIKTLVDEFYFKAITGEINVDEEWDAYIKRVNDAGYSKLEEEVNKVPLYSDILE